MKRRVILLAVSFSVTTFLLFLLASCSLIGQTKPDPWAVYRPGLGKLSQSILDERDNWTRYKLGFEINPQDRSLTGRARVHVTNSSSVSWPELYFQLFPNLPQLQGNMDVTSVQLGEKDTPFTYAADRTAIRVSLTPALEPQASTELEFAFTIEIPAIEKGYVLFGESQSILNLPFSYPMLAVFDEAAQRQGAQVPWRIDLPAPYGDIAFTQSALYEVTATVPSDYAIVATGVTMDRKTREDGKANWHWVSGPSREWMMTMSPQFKVASTQAYSTTVNSYYLPADEEAGKAALLYAASALRVYQDHYGRYPYPQMDIVASPLQYRGMEFPGLDLIGIDLYRERRQDLEFLIAHEVAHQWWYNLVGNDPVQQPWLDEGLAEYSTYIYWESVHGKREAEKLRVIRWVAAVDYAKANGLDAKVDQPAEMFGAHRYETNVYAKAALFFHAVREAIGNDDAFFRVLQTYVDKYYFKEAQPIDFLTIAEKISGKSLKSVYDQWILQGPN